MKNKILRYIILTIFGFTVVFWGCGKRFNYGNNCTGECIIFSGNVKDDLTNDPLSNVIVKLSAIEGIFISASAKTYTDENGDYRFSMEDSLFNEDIKANISYTKDYYLGESIYLTDEELLDNQVDLEKISLQKAGRLSVTVKINNKKFKRLKIEITGKNNNIIYHLSNESYPNIKTFSKLVPINKEILINVKISKNKKDFFSNSWTKLEGYPKKVILSHGETLTFNEVID